jgi:hypothetical protein
LACRLTNVFVLVYALGSPVISAAAGGLVLAVGGSVTPAITAAIIGLLAAVIAVRNA